jgi:hypothetical protein
VKEEIEEAVVQEGVVAESDINTFAILFLHAALVAAFFCI